MHYNLIEFLIRLLGEMSTRSTFDHESQCDLKIEHWPPWSTTVSAWLQRSSFTTDFQLEVSAYLNIQIGIRKCTLRNIINKWNWPILDNWDMAHSISAVLSSSLIINQWGEQALEVIEQKWLNDKITSDVPYPAALRPGRENLLGWYPLGCLI